MKTNPDSRPIIEIGEANFESEVLRWKQPVLVNNSTGITQQSNLICYARLPRKGKVMNRFSSRTVIVTGGARGNGCQPRARLRRTIGAATSSSEKTAPAVAIQTSWPTSHL